jgi:hypothetical protein
MTAIRHTLALDDKDWAEVERRFFSEAKPFADAQDVFKLAREIADEAQVGFDVKDGKAHFALQGPQADHWPL